MTGKKQKRIAVVVCACVAAVFVLWFCWNSYSAAREDYVSERVRQSLNDGLTAAVYRAPREVWVVNRGVPFYAVSSDKKVMDDQQRKIYDVLLEDLQSDDLPACKASGGVTLHLDGDEIHTGLSATAAMDFELAPGITRTVVVTERVMSPRFQSATENAVMKDTAPAAPKKQRIKEYGSKPAQPAGAS